MTSTRMPRGRPVVSRRRSLFDERALWTNSVYQITQDHQTACGPSELDDLCQYPILFDRFYYTSAQDGGADAGQIGVGNRRLMPVVMRARL